MGRPVIAATECLHLRQTRWELFQTVREVPLMYGGLVEDTVVVPMHLTLLQLQARLDYRAPYPQLWSAIAVDHHNWVTTRRDLPVTERETTGRGSADTLRASRGICRDFIAAWVAHAHMENHCKAPPRHAYATAQDLLQKIAQKYGENVHDMRITTHRRLLSHDEPLIALVRYPLVVHSTRLMARPDYSSRFDILWQARDDADAIPTYRRAGETLPGTENVYDICTVGGVGNGLWMPHLKSLEVEPSHRSSRIMSHMQQCTHGLCKRLREKCRNSRKQPPPSSSRWRPEQSAQPFMQRALPSSTSHAGCNEARGHSGAKNRDSPAASTTTETSRARR